jgi:hypothetical protein
MVSVRRFIMRSKNTTKNNMPRNPTAGANTDDDEGEAVGILHRLDLVLVIGGNGLFDAIQARLEFLRVAFGRHFRLLTRLFHVPHHGVLLRLKLLVGLDNVLRPKCVGSSLACALSVAAELVSAAKAFGETIRHTATENMATTDANLRIRRFPPIIHGPPTRNVEESGWKYNAKISRPTLCGCIFGGHNYTNCER